MRRKWKSVAALGMAALLGCLMPMNTMLAAEEDTEAVQEMEAESDTDAVSDDEAISDDNESIVDEEDAEDEIPGDEVNLGDEINADDENAVDDANAEDEDVVDEAGTDNDGNEGIQVMAVTDDPETGGVEVQENTDAPVIDIKWNGQSCTYELGGTIEYQYVKDPDQRLELSASQDGKAISFYYYLDKNPGAAAMGEDQVNWSDAISSLSTVVEVLSSNKTYVVYVKAEANGQTVYARSCGIVVDTEAPKVTGVADGGTYPEGTVFHVEDANLESVTVNGESIALAADGNYQVTEDGTSCEIKAKDKAGNETVCGINVSGGRELADGGAISANGTYSLKANTSYQLAAGEWQVGGDSTVYQGGGSFYVKEARDYRFTKR